ncbi:GLPGLI family protein [Ferruginibacter sp.]|nr:GLPGLI family protein [Ferruginibacter sp.]
MKASLFIFLLTLAGFSQAQKPEGLSYDILCTYRLDYQPDSTDVKSRKSEEMLLFLSKSHSLFKSKNMYLRDSASAKDETTNNFGSMSFALSVQTNFQYNIVKDTTGKITTIDYVHRDRYEYIEPRQSFNWSVSEDTSTINGIKCQKAETNFSGRNWIAWFSMDIPSTDGPYKFNGLPGLIIKISDSSGYYTFLLTQYVNKKITVAFPKSQPPIKVTKLKFYTTLKYFNENRYEIEQLRGVTFTSGQEQFKKRFEELAKKNNNPIELITISK